MPKSKRIKNYLLLKKIVELGLGGQLELSIRL